jgi:hypothetical protein
VDDVCYEEECYFEAVEGMEGEVCGSKSFQALYENNFYLTLSDEFPVFTTRDEARACVEILKTFVGTSGPSQQP